MAEETAKGSITLADPNNGPSVRWAADRIEEFTNGAPVGAGYTVQGAVSEDGRTLTLTLTRNEACDAKEQADG